MDPSKSSPPATELDRLFAEAHTAVEAGAYDRGMQVLSRTLAFPVNRTQEELRSRLMERLRGIQPSGNGSKNTTAESQSAAPKTDPLKASAPPAQKAQSIGSKDFEEVRRLAKAHAAGKQNDETDIGDMEIDRYVHPNMLFATWNIKAGKSLPENDPKISEALVGISQASRELNSKTRFNTVHMIVVQLERFASQGEVAIDPNALATLRALLVGRSLLAEEQLEEDDL
jgi:hypothetical protein